MGAGTPRLHHSELQTSRDASQMCRSSCCFVSQRTLQKRLRMDGRQIAEVDRVFRKGSENSFLAEAAKGYHGGRRRLVVRSERRA